VVGVCHAVGNAHFWRKNGAKRTAPISSKQACSATVSTAPMSRFPSENNTKVSKVIILSISIEFRAT